MKVQKSAVSKALSSSDCKETKRFFLQPIKKVFIDSAILGLINSVMVYCFLCITTDTTIAMIGAFWVGIIAWRGGVLAGMLGSIIISCSNVVAIHMSAHGNIQMTYFFNNKIPGIILGLSQCVIVGLVVGYISTLIHQLREEITLRKKTQKDLEHKIAELDAFGHTVAHDLKNPLMVIDMSIESLMAESISTQDESINKRLAFINDGTKHMINIIESILMLAGIKRIDPGEFKLFSISESVDEALKRMAYNIESNGVRIIKPDSWPSVFGYAPWITVVWVNYISNAVKYGGNPSLKIKPVIELGYDKPDTSDHIRFWVKDNGEGIASEKTGTLFKEFTRLHTGSKKGFGLGLSIVKTVIDKFNGNVGVESELGKGSLFYFTLPGGESSES